MTDPGAPPPLPPADSTADTPADDHREPPDSPQRRLVDTVQAYEVDPPPPARAQDGDRPDPA